MRLPILLAAVIIHGASLLACATGPLTYADLADDDAGRPVGSSGHPRDAGPPVVDAGKPPPEAGTLLGDGAVVDAGPGCSSEARDFVYVLSLENDLYRFAPDKKQFTKVGTLGCNTALTPNSMAVDRNAVAWVDYVAPDDSEGAIFQVSTSDASCSGPVVSLPGGWRRLGMGFATDDAQSSSETLYVVGDTAVLGSGSSPGLGWIDRATGQLTPLGAFSGSLTGQSAELTGTGDQRLFAFFRTSPVQVAQVDPSSATLASVTGLASVETPVDWAFSFWGGKFYLYTCPNDPTRTSNVTQYDPATGATDTSYMVDVGFRIVGAGVSTCAPTTPPL
jgi:hypothetical protein